MNVVNDEQAWREKDRETGCVRKMLVRWVDGFDVARRQSVQTQIQITDVHLTESTHKLATILAL